MAAVRGMGVAVITNTSGTAVPLSRSAARCSTPKRCCSSITATPRDRNATRSWMRAWVPITKSTAPSSSDAPSRARSDAVVREVSSSTRTGRSPKRLSPSAGRVRPSMRAFMLRWCCSARTSVGAMKAPWWPPWTATSRAVSETRVLPEPTSPCRRRCMGTGVARSAPISVMARRWAPVRAKGSWRWKRSTRSPSSWWATPTAVRSSSRLRRTNTTWMRSSSSNTRRRRAWRWSSADSGRWMPRSAAVRSTRSKPFSTSGVTGSAKVPARSSASATQSPSSQVVSPAFSDWG